MNFTEIILRELQKCPLLKKSGVTALGFAGMDAKTRSISVLNTKGELVTEEYCDGSREMQFPFALIYRSPELDTAGKLAAQELIDGVADWLTAEENLPTIEGVQVRKISRADTSRLFRRTRTARFFKALLRLNITRKIRITPRIRRIFLWLQQLKTRQNEVIFTRF